MVQRQTSVDASQSLKDTGFFCLFVFFSFLFDNLYHRHKTRICSCFDLNPVGKSCQVWKKQSMTFHPALVSVLLLSCLFIFAENGHILMV